MTPVRNTSAMTDAPWSPEDTDTRVSPGMTGATQFWIPGKPVQQGSKNISRKGKVYEAAKGHKTWRQTVTEVAWTHMRTRKVQPYTQARIWATFVFPRPKAHYRADGTIKPQLLDVLHLTYPDLDKLDRCLRDGLTQSGILFDDKVIYGGVSRKIYVNPNAPDPGCLVTIRP